jgi:acetylornithine/succinyldiaminopimelate/putrescine aminotransferase
VPHPALAETCAQIIQGRVPNFFRLYLNPFAIGACFCLDRYVRDTWPGYPPSESPNQSFLANSFDEALSGAIKLVRYSGHLEGRAPAGLVVDPGGRLGPFASVSVEGGDKVEFIPGLTVVGEAADLDAARRFGERFGFVVLVAPPEPSPWPAPDVLRELIRRRAPLLVTCLDRRALATCRREPSDFLRGLTPDVVVFDESFTDHQVPFAAFTARKALFAHWNKPGRSTFHSTTFQPNTLSSLHFLRCLERSDPEFYSAVRPELERLRRNPTFCATLLGAFYSPFLARAITTLGFDTLDVQASGHYIVAGGRKIFDGVAGVACSIRGHNPEGYVREVEGVSAPDLHQAVCERLRELTGLGHVLPAVSGASAVENALRIGLAAQFPRKWVIAFKGGFGGKTLLALTGTAVTSYKSHLEPLYENVLYLDPFSPTAVRDLESALEKYPVAVVQVELIQAVGGVRPIPAHVLGYLQDNKDRWGYLLFVDEVQTGMYRTGPFTLSEKAGLAPDLLTLGKGTSDMMFPFSLTLYSAAVEKRLAEVQPGLAGALRERCEYDFGYRTVLSTLERAEGMHLADRVAEAGALFARLLPARLTSCKAVREVRVFGLLIAIELDTARWPFRWLKNRAAWSYLMAMLRHEAFPLFIGYCQYEPNVIKLTPPLSITPAEVRRVCDTLAEVLNRPPSRLLAASLGALARSFIRRPWRPRESRT